MTRQTQSLHTHESTRSSPLQREESPISGFRVGRLFGVEITVDWSLTIIFLLILFSLGARWFPNWHPDWSAVTVWSAALVAAVLFFVSILAHELSHAIVARRNGIPVNRITLFMFGGLAHMEKDPPSAGAEFRMAVVGPAVSIALGLLSWTVAQALSPALDPELAADPEAFFGRLGPVASVFTWLGMVNIVLGIFNMIPGFPLDGGRVLRAGLWRLTGDRRKASLWASYAGRAFAVLLITYGLFAVFAGGFLGGFWWVLIGWFLYAAAQGSYGHVVIQDALEEVPVRQVMRSAPATVTSDLTLSIFVQEHIMRSDQGTFPVLEGDTLLGMASLEDVRKVPRERWDAVRVADVMTPANRLSTLKPDDEAVDAFQQLATRGVRQIPVVEDGHLEGVVRRDDLLRWVSLHTPQRS